MKSGLKTTDKPGGREKFPHDINRFQIRPVVERCKADPVLHALKHFLVQFVDAQMTLGKCRFKAYPLDRIDGGDHTGLGAGKIIKEKPDAAGIVRNVCLIERNLFSIQTIPDNKKSFPGLR